MARLEDPRAVDALGRIVEASGRIPEVELPPEVEPFVMAVVDGKMATWVAIGTLVGIGTMLERAGQAYQNLLKGGSSKIVAQNLADLKSCLSDAENLRARLERGNK